MVEEETVVQFSLSAARALARLLSACGFGNDGGETSCSEEAGAEGEENGDDRGDDEGDTDDIFPPMRGPLPLLLGLPVAVLYRSAVLHGDGDGGDGAVMRRW